MATRWISLVLLLAVVIVIVAYQVGMNGQSTQARYPISRTVKYSLTVENSTNKAITQASFWLYTPVDQGVYQALDDIQSSHPYHAKVDESGNQRLHFTVNQLAPYGKKTYEVTAKIKLSELPNTMPSIHSEDFLSEEAFIEISEPRIQTLAQRLVADTEGKTVKNIYRWVTENIKKTGYIKRNQGAAQTLMTQSGDCTNTMCLFSALSRANGIPTRNMAGFTAKENAVLKPRDYHNWVEVFVDGKWRLVDPDREISMDQAADYIAMTVLTDASSTESQLTQRLFGGSEKLEITLN